MERAVARGQRAKAFRVPALIGIDEKAIAKGHRYLTLVCDLETGTVEYLGDDRKQESLDGYWQTARRRRSAPRSPGSRWTCGRRTSDRS
jgi:hypothetical protein